jgi:hypothetical protein
MFTHSPQQSLSPRYDKIDVYLSDHRLISQKGRGTRKAHRLLLAEEGKEHALVVAGGVARDRALEGHAVPLLVRLRDLLQVHLGAGGDDPGQGVLVGAQPRDGLPDHLLEVPLRAGEATDDCAQCLQELVLGVSLQILLFAKFFLLKIAKPIIHKPKKSRTELIKMLMFFFYFCQRN